jgi:hypothetical protein
MTEDYIHKSGLLVESKCYINEGSASPPTSEQVTC